MRSLLLLTTLLIHKGLTCISSAPRQYSAPSAPSYQYGVPQYSAPSASQYSGAGQQAVGGAGQQANYYYQQAAAAGSNTRLSAAGASNVESLQPISGGGRLTEGLFGSRVTLSEFSSNGYNAEGGGPVAHGAALGCDFEGRACCWANVPSPDDQIDWHMASGVPESQHFQNVSIDGKYLVAYSSGAAPSDEAQFASCSIGCASSPIRVRARHWQSQNVLLQVCQRESFPNSVNFNPLLNCQEFPMTDSIQYTEVVLPKASLVDIVFVASNFVNENGDIAVLDNIETIYESDPAECDQATTGAGGAGHSIRKSTDGPDQTGSEKRDQIISSTKRCGDRGSLGGSGVGAGNEVNGITGTGSGSGGDAAVDGASSGVRLHGVNGIDGATAEENSANGQAASSSSSSAAASSSASAASSSSSSSSASASASSTNLVNTKEENTVISSIRSCQTLKCTFEDGSSCSYKDTYESESVRGLTTRFQVVKGQFMNRVTGVPDAIQGDYYAATYLYPREKAGLLADLNHLGEDRRLRFQYYEGTHGVQLKGCCDSVDVCPFSSDKFVTVSDRMWKFGSFVCPQGTQKLIFLCENTRTNQGACALDDIQVVENKEGVTLEDKPLC
ncbi:hypothetical protein Ddc_06806 [Ditylenchus destructor]|nr:hypothetical protein Ddc_06806 [Ditylenchus destructor]